MRKILMLLVLSFSATAFQGDDIDLTPPEFGEFDPASVSDIDISAYPLLPEVTDHARQIYQEGVAQGNHPQIFSKVGDCMTAAEYFLTPFGLNAYDLGQYGDLQEVVDYFNAQPAREGDWELDSFANPGLATASGFNTASVLDPIWSNPEWCDANESPLSCEYRVSKPIFSLIMFGTNDTFFIEADAFDYYLRLIVLETIQQNIVPVLYTFPTRPEYPEKSELFNQIIIKIAEDYDLPLINLWLGLQDLPNGGVDEIETIHLTIPADGTSTGVFDDSTLQTGYTYRNLVTLQALDILVKGLTEEA